jgi:prepilin-type N-terminal cleavage/methylation domain-containing protein
MARNKLNYKVHGFTLMEILAALLLIGLILPVAMKGVSLASMLASDSVRKYEALDLAQTRLAEILLQKDWQSSSGSGTFEDEYDQYHWMMEVSDGSVAGLKQIDLVVYWQQRNRQKNIMLSTFIYANE